MVSLSFSCSADAGRHEGRARLPMAQAPSPRAARRAGSALGVGLGFAAWSLRPILAGLSLGSIEAKGL